MTTVDRGAWSGPVDDTALVTAMLDTEVALVQAQADVGVVPRAAADAILAAGALAEFDPSGHATISGLLVDRALERFMLFAKTA